MIVFAAVSLAWDIFVTISLFAALGLVLGAIWAIDRWHSEWRHEPPQQVRHVRAHLFVEEDRDGPRG